MQSEFETACTKTREDIAVPDFSLAAIRARNERIAPSRRGRRGVFAAIAIGLSMAAIAAAAVIGSSHFAVTKSGGLVITGPSLKSISNPRISEVAAAAADMDFNVTLPASLPAGTKLKMLILFGRDGFALGYDMPGAWRRSHHYMNVVILNPSSLQGTSTGKQRMSLMLGDGVKFKTRNHLADTVWRIGDEDVFIQTSVLTPAEAAKMKAAMEKEAAR